MFDLSTFELPIIEASFQNSAISIWNNEYWLIARIMISQSKTCPIRSLHERGVECPKRPEWRAVVKYSGFSFVVQVRLDNTMSVVSRHLEALDYDLQIFGEIGPIHYYFGPDGLLTFQF
jgi:hypothetical protein